MLHFFQFPGNGTYGRLGIGSTESVSMPTLLKSIQHIVIVKIAVDHATGKHCLALSQDGEVSLEVPFTLKMCYRCVKDVFSLML